MIRHPLLAGGALALASIGLAVPAVAAPVAATPLTGTVGPGFTITLAKAGKKVTSLRAGAYAITVTDRARIHDFRLLGPGVNKVITTVPFQGRKTALVTLVRGTYTYQCDPHAAGGMKGTFKVS